MPNPRRQLLLSGLTVLAAQGLWAQAPPASAPAPPAAAANPFQMSPEERQRLQLAREDHADMMEQLGITKLRPGRQRPRRAGDAERRQLRSRPRPIPFPTCRIRSRLKNGQKVTTAEQWWKQRRPEIVEDFEREVYRPRAEERAEGDVDGRRDSARPTRRRTSRSSRKQLVGHVDNSALSRHQGGHPDDLVTPANAKRPGAGADDVRRLRRQRLSAASRRARASRRAFGGPSPIRPRPNN